MKISVFILSGYDYRSVCAFILHFLFTVDNLYFRREALLKTWVCLSMKRAFCYSCRYIQSFELQMSRKLFYSMQNIITLGRYHRPGIRTSLRTRDLLKSSATPSLIASANVPRRVFFDEEHYIVLDSWIQIFLCTCLLMV